MTPLMRALPAVTLAADADMLGQQDWRVRILTNERVQWPDVCSWRGSARKNNGKPCFPVCLECYGGRREGSIAEFCINNDASAPSCYLPGKRSYLPLALPQLFML